MTGVAIIQGASRGLGLQFCRSILTTKPNCLVVASCRDPNSANSLQDLHKHFPKRLEIVQIDATNETDIKNVAEHVGKKYKKLDLLVNCAGMLHPSGKGETSMKDVSSEGLMRTFATNTVGPVLMVKYFSPFLMKGEAFFGSTNVSDKERHTSVLVNLSAKVGSIGDNGLGGWFSYRLSKSALNMANKNFSIELGRGKRKVICLALHPGTVDTDLSRPYHKNVPKDKLFSTEYSVSKMMEIIDGANITKSGNYYSWDGLVIPY